jgi:DNA repair exonuclease SbcCD nuclease subunit
MKLFHTSDLHLGRRRLDGRLPDSDLAEAFGHIADAAIQEGADAFLIAGDLFDKPQVEPPHLRQAQGVLARLKEAGIPVLAIEGNHDRASVHGDEPTWVRFLAEDGLLTLLSTPFDGDGPRMDPWDPATRRGAHVDLKGFRFVGAGYLGAATTHKVREIASRLDPELPHVLLLHAGPDYFVGEGGGFRPGDLAALRERVDYLALGHIHKPMLHGGWACNPGSPENCHLREAGYGLGEARARGYAVVSLDPRRREGPLDLEIRSNPRRPVLSLTLDCTPFGNKLKDGAEALVKAAAKAIAARHPQPSAVVDLTLAGRLNLNRIALDPTQAALRIQEAAGVEAVALDAGSLNLEKEGSPGVEEGHAPTREDLERQAILQVVRERALPGLEEREGDLAELFFGLKEGVKGGRSPEELAEALLQSPLVDRILAAREEAR